MEVQLTNEKCTAKINSHGAELTSLVLKETGMEYIWQGDPEYWGRHTPVLFPHVGRLKNDAFIHEGVTYTSTQHGFARDSEFEIVEQTDTKAVFRLTDSEETLKRYPFHFQLFLTFELLEDGIVTEWKVVNPDDKTLYFGIGGHPAFNVPLEKGLSFEDYFFEISPSSMKKRIPFVPPYLDVTNAKEESVDKVAIFHEQFHNDALVYETKEPTSITIRSEKSPHQLTLSYENIPYVGLWSPYPKKSPFVCIEPWWSFADTPEDTGVLSEKTSIQTLAPHQEFTTSYTLTIQ